MYITVKLLEWTSLHPPGEDFVLVPLTPPYLPGEEVVHVQCSWFWVQHGAQCSVLSEYSLLFDTPGNGWCLCGVCNCTGGYSGPNCECEPPSGPKCTQPGAVSYLCQVFTHLIADTLFRMSVLVSWLLCMYSEISLIRHNSFSKNMVD